MQVKNVFFHRHESGKLVGFADIQFSIYDGDEGLITIKGWKVFRDPDGYSVQAPSTKKDGTNGPEYYPTVFFSKDSVAEDFLSQLKIRVSAAVERGGSRGKEKTQQSSAPQRSSGRQQANPYGDDELDPF